MAKAHEILEKMKTSPKLVLLVVSLALFMDGLLLTAPVPILPEYIFALEHRSHDTYRSTRALRDGLWYIQNQLRTFNMTSPKYTVPSNASNARPLSQGGGDDIQDENSEIGWLLSSKSIVQLAADVILGPLTNRIGYSIPMFVGITTLFISSLVFAFAQSYSWLFVARAVHGIGSACLAIAGFSLLADRYPDDAARTRAMSIAVGGIATGVLVGYQFGGLMYQFLGKMIPFLVIAALCLCDGVLQCIVMQPCYKEHHYLPGTPLIKLLTDPYILIASGALFLCEMAVAVQEPTLPLWLMDTIRPEKWQLGIIFLPGSLAYVIGTFFMGVFVLRVGRWISTIVSLVLVGTALFAFPFATIIPHLIVPDFCLGLGVGIVDASVLPMLAYLVDKRHTSVYGGVYAISQVALSLGFAVGPSLGGQFVEWIGFPWLMRGMAVTCFAYAPLCYLLRDPPCKDENTSILADQESPAVYTEEKTTEIAGYTRLN